MIKRVLNPTSWRLIMFGFRKCRAVSNKMPRTLYLNKYNEEIRNTIIFVYVTFNSIKAN